MSQLSIEDINSVLKSKLKSENFQLISCEELKGDIATGFLSATQKLCIKYNKDSRDEKLNLFIKKMPESAYHQKLIISSGGFRKEVMIFEKFLKDLNSKFQGDPIPTYYLGRPDDIVVLKDISYEGFSNMPLLETFSVDHCLKASESMSKIHAASLVFEAKGGNKINEYIPALKEETLFTEDENLTTRKAVKVGLKALRKIKDKYFPQYEEELTELVFKYMDKTYEHLRASTKYQNVLSHSDLWANNIMFRYNSEGTVAEACIIDFQVAAYRPLAFDILMLIYLCTNKELRDNHLNLILMHYYRTLSNEVQTEGVNLADIVSWSQFEDMVEELRPVFLAFAPQMLHFVIMPSKILKEVSEDEEKWISYFEEDRSEFALRAAEEYAPYRSRVVGSLAELFEYFESQNKN